MNNTKSVWQQNSILDGADYWGFYNSEGCPAIKSNLSATHTDWSRCQGRGDSCSLNTTIFF